MLSQGNQYKVEARITFQTTWSEQILHKPSLFFGKRRFLNFQNRTSQNANRPEAGLRPGAISGIRPALGRPKADNRKMTFF